MQRASLLDDQINLALFGVSIKPNVAQVFSRVHIGFEDLGHREGLEYVSLNGTTLELIGCCPAR